MDPENGRPVAANSTFESILGPLYKFREWDFADAASADVNPNSGENNDASTNGVGGGDANRSRFRDAIDSVRRKAAASSSSSALAGVGGEGDVDDETWTTGMGGAPAPAAAPATARIRNVEMLALGTNDAGMPVRRHFDWTIGSVAIAPSPSSSSSSSDEGDSGLPPSVVVMYGDVVNEAESSDR